MTLRVLTPQGLFLSDEAVSIRAPAGLGYLGVLRNHAPLVSTVVPGRLTWRTGDGVTHQLRLGGGLLEIERNRITVLTDSVTESPLLRESDQP